ncbi:hypothetical protein SDRG_05004 [Saprolegnia diclina VS20]|uniref:Histone deacetylase n=1 Tax=Saprolegnia diclina (strain VS20) TaxID=1156394 RepID=T0QTS0_SAPDV|nr:hypothetical protein SDRG_05004 [Saprolegnia diclina VS20]EQC37400.1 hypothetical protein SDRG_05004 [Saprolegnia diclina VS20]|eukprot:XP_008608920.1 hypothetical protein SDRG_05004 [Saprolegnia diclina VS20]
MATAPVAVVFSSDYAQAVSRLPVHPQREVMTFSLLQHLRLLDRLHVVAPTPATDADLARFHAPRYIAALQNASTLSLDEQLEFGLTDDACAFDGLERYCSYVAGGSITAATLLTLTSPARPVDVAVHWGGGRHHAKKASASGFCYVNDVVLAVDVLLKSSPAAKVLVVDMDVHHGDGVEEAYYYSTRVFTLSFHKYARGFFPNSGAPSRIGAGPGKHTNLNVPLDDGITNEQFLEVFELLTSTTVDVFAPTHLVLVCGVDTLGSDPLGTFNLTAEGVGWCVQVVQELDLPLLVLGGGGYNVPDAARTFAHVTATLLGVEADVPTTIPEHEYFDRYGPYFTLQTRPNIGRVNLNTIASLEATCATALQHLERTKAAVASSQSQKRRDNF